MASPLAASDLQSSWIEDTSSSAASYYGRQEGPLKTLEEADYKQALIYGAEGHYPDAFYDFLYGVGVRLTPKDRQDLQQFMINTHKIYCESMETWHVANVFCNTDRFPDTLSSMSFVVNCLVSEGWEIKKVMSLVDLRMVEIVRRGGYAAFKAILSVHTDLARRSIKTFLTPAYMDQVAASLDLAALITHLDQKGEAPSLETLHQFPHLLKKSFMSRVAAPVFSYNNTTPTTKEMGPETTQEATKVCNELTHAFEHTLSTTTELIRPETWDLLNDVKSSDGRERLKSLLSDHNRSALIGADLFQAFFIQQVAEFYSYELQEEFIDYFRNHSFKDFVQIKQVDVSKRLLKLFHPQVAQTMKALKNMRGMMSPRRQVSFWIARHYTDASKRSSLIDGLCYLLKEATKKRTSSMQREYFDEKLNLIDYHFEIYYERGLL